MVGNGETSPGKEQSPGRLRHLARNSCRGRRGAHAGPLVEGLGDPPGGASHQRRPTAQHHSRDASIILDEERTDAIRTKTRVHREFERRNLPPRTTRRPSPPPGTATAAPLLTSARVSARRVGVREIRRRAVTMTPRQFAIGFDLTTNAGPKPRWPSMRSIATSQQAQPLKWDSEAKRPTRIRNHQKGGSGGEAPPSEARGLHPRKK